MERLGARGSLKSRGEILDGRERWRHAGEIAGQSDRRVPQIGFVQLGTVAAGAHRRGVQGRSHVRGPTKPLHTRLLPLRNSRWCPSSSDRHQLHAPRGAQRNLPCGPLLAAAL
ncbi:hypothetical protein NDU88_001521 [Pleurodeles waltl]|uniref:Uncharacterized protein n=1 Tax=Pleurodeles waltl TaxID=8319 RepID=A0AAV7UAF6_PLEWA|nr:hypothetical protein NDU88_001521 [Pleurodeles waltl]